MYINPMLEDGCIYIGSGSYEGGYFKSDDYKFDIVEVLSYYDVPLSMILKGNDGYLYLSEPQGNDLEYLLYPVNEQKISHFKKWLDKEFKEYEFDYGVADFQLNMNYLDEDDEIINLFK